MNNRNKLFNGKHGPLLIAEIGGNHEGDFEYAKKLTSLAIESDVDYIKFQIYTGDTLVSKVESPIRNKHFKKFQLSKEQYFELAKICSEGGVGFMASVWDISAIKWINELMPIYKIGSGDMTAYPIIKEICKLSKPIILSTGLSTMLEVQNTLDYIKALNPVYLRKDMLAVLQCTSMYPISYGDSNLNVMNEYKNSFGCVVGYSDHTEGSYALEIAVAKGAEILEFHFTDKREGKTFRDHSVSLTKNEVSSLIEKIQLIKSLEGSSIKTPLVSERDHVISFRRAIYPKQDLPKGTILNKNNLVFLRPNHGIDARDYEKIIGRELIEDVKKFQPLNYKSIK